jgi:hypothetical protein
LSGYEVMCHRVRLLHGTKMLSDDQCQNCKFWISGYDQSIPKAV